MYALQVVTCNADGKGAAGRGDDDVVVDDV